MFSRKNSLGQGTPLPRAWIEDTESLLLDAYAQYLKEFGKAFFVMGRTYPNELWAAFCLLPKDSDGLPVTYSVSSDLQRDSHSKKILSSLLDSAGMFFDSYFANPRDWSDYNPHWSKVALNGEEFFSCITRENFKLSAQAEKLLATLHQKRQDGM